MVIDALATFLPRGDVKRGGILALGFILAACQVVIPTGQPDIFETSLANVEATRASFRATQGALGICLDESVASAMATEAALGPNEATSVAAIGQSLTETPVPFCGEIRATVTPAAPPKFH